MEALGEVARVFAFGAKKYAAFDWKTTEHYRYVDALYRHMADYLSGEDYDKETGLPHLAHAASNCLILLWHFLHLKPENRNRFGE